MNILFCVNENSSGNLIVGLLMWLTTSSHDSLYRIIDSGLEANNHVAIPAKAILLKIAINKLQFTNRIFIELPIKKEAIVNYETAN